MHVPVDQTKCIDFCLRLAGFGLAGSALYLVFRMTLFAAPTPVINGEEYLSIYAKPKTPAATVRRPRFQQEVDYASVGSLAAARSNPLLSEFEVLDSTADVATLRTLHGRILRVTRGTTLVGGGSVLWIRRINGRWIVRTTKGTIRQN